jgi:transposase
MLYVGIDVASEKHDCCILDQKKNILSSFSFANSQQGFDLFLNSVSRFDTPENTWVGLEATGIYGTNLTFFLRRNGIQVTTLNPLLLKNNRKGTTLRKTKTDKTDAKHIASFLMQEAPQPDLPASYHISELKSLTRLRFHTVKDRSAAKVKAQGILQILFPEFKMFFSDVFGSTATAILCQYPSAKSLAGVRTDTLEKIIRTASRGRLGKEKAVELKAAAKNSIGTYSTALELNLQMLLESISLYSKQILVLEGKIKELMVQIDSPITTIPGIGWTLGAIILAEIGDIKRFSSPAKLLSFAGSEPSVYQSGKFSASSGKMVKRGSPYLRWALLQAARTVPKFSLTFASYFNKKRNEGKHYCVAASHCAKKLIRIIFALLNNNSSFSDNFCAPAY